jgi:hypothetical protein
MYTLTTPYLKRGLYNNKVFALLTLLIVEEVSRYPVAKYLITPSFIKEGKHLDRTGMPPN